MCGKGTKIVEKKTNVCRRERKSWWNGECVERGLKYAIQWPICGRWRS